MQNIQLDDADRKILGFLIKNARMPFLEIARECGVSGAAIHQRVRRLENAGIITGSRMVVKPEALGLNVCAFIMISLSEGDKSPIVMEALKKIPEVVECHFITGRYAMLLKLYCFDNEHLLEVVVNGLQKIPFIQSTETLISLQQPVERQIWVKEYENTRFNSSPAKKAENKKSDSRKKGADKK